MRHTKQELRDFLLTHSDYFSEVVAAGIIKIANLNIPHVYDSNKRSLFSHLVRSFAFDYIRKNPRNGLRLDAQQHSMNQSVVLVCSATQLEMRIVTLTAFKPIQQLELPHVSHAGTQGSLFPSPRPAQSPGVVGLSYTRPKLDTEGTPLEEVSITAVRAQAGLKLSDGVADAVIPLSNKFSQIPKRSFDPNAEYEFEADSNDNFGTTRL